MILTLNNKTYELRPTYGIFRDILDQVGDPAKFVMDHLRYRQAIEKGEYPEPPFSSDVVIKIIAIALKNHGEKFSDDEIGEMVINAGLVEASAEVALFLYSMITGNRDTEKEAPGKRKPPLARAKS